ncbi:transcription termination factor, mitochondrial isoform X2 [Aricia agestis]|nr:transcription termination factor, mitochondrial isoform X2 [Aricia agestis]
MRTLLHIYKTTLRDNECGYCQNRLYYLSDCLKCPPSILGKLVAKRTFIYSLSFEWLQNSMNILKDYNVSNERILRDLWVLKYHSKTIEDRFLRVKNSGINTYYPWMVRCSEDILRRYIAISQETKSILGETNTTKNYLAQRLNTTPEFVDEIFLKVKTLKCIRVTKVKKFMDFLTQEGFAVEEIANKPRILAASQDTIAQRIRKLRSLGVDKINLSVLYRSKKDFKKICDSMMYAKAGVIKDVEK